VFDHIQAEFNKAQSDDKKLDNLIVLGGCAAIEKQQKRSCDSAFTAGRADVTRTDRCRII
jgi:catalase (peroxidase I)